MIYEIIDYLHKDMDNKQIHKNITSANSSDSDHKSLCRSLKEYSGNIVGYKASHWFFRKKKIMNMHMYQNQWKIIVYTCIDIDCILTPFILLLWILNHYLIPKYWSLNLSYLEKKTSTLFTKSSFSYPEWNVLCFPKPFA